MQNILKPWVESYVETHGLPKDQKCILFIDCYPVHIGKEFRIFVLKDFRNVFLIFVPANCTSVFLPIWPAHRSTLGTGMFQPADVGIQRVLKHFIRQRMLEYLVNSHTTQVSSGLTPEQVKFTTSYPALRDASVRPIVEAFKFFNNPDGRDIIRRVGYH